MIKEIEKVFRDRLVFVVSQDTAEDKRPRFILLGTPQEVIDEIKDIAIYGIIEILNEVRGGKDD